jgi:potassium voltage-gated channel Eag-related subfamily H protein 8
LEIGQFPKILERGYHHTHSKPGKDHSDPSNYRPIALTSCICKTMERMINDRLVWFLESHNLLADILCGFRSQRSTLDHLVKLESFIRDAFINNEQAVSIFFSIWKRHMGF